jgi:outer membrane protein
MRKLLKTLILSLVLLGGTSAFAQQYKIATVDLGRMFTNYWKTKQAQVVIDGMKSDIESKGRDLMTTFNKSKEEYQKMMDSVNDPAVSPEARDKRKKAAEDKLKDLKDQDDTLTQFTREQQTRLDEQLKRTRDNIVSEIRVAVTARAKMDGYTLVIDSAAISANGTPVVLYTLPNENDITEPVLKQLNVGAPMDFPKTDDKPATGKTGK